MRPKRRRPSELLTEYDMRSVRARQNVSEGQTLTILPRKRIETSEIDEDPQRQKSSFCFKYGVLIFLYLSFPSKIPLVAAKRTKNGRKIIRSRRSPLCPIGTPIIEGITNSRMNRMSMVIV